MHELLKINPIILRCMKQTQTNISTNRYQINLTL